MELSQNARAFSIQSLMSTSPEKDGGDLHCLGSSGDRGCCSSGPRPEGKGSAGWEPRHGGVLARSAPGESTPSDPADRCPVYRVAPLLRGIPARDDGEPRERHPRSSPPAPGRDVPPADRGAVGQPSVRPKVRRAGDLDRDAGGIPHRGGQRSKSGIGLQARSPDRRLLLGADYILTEAPYPVQHLPIKDEDPSPGNDGWEPGDAETGDRPISKCVDGIQVTLENSRLWRLFNRCGTEMIVNRVGRRMFPCVAVTMLGMDPEALYRVQMQLDSSDRRRYKFINGKWMAVGKAESEPTNKLYEHHDSPGLGAFWMRERVSFAKLKISNNSETGGLNTVLHSMHRYTPRIIVTKLRRSPANAEGVAAPCSDPNLPTEGGVARYCRLLPDDTDAAVALSDRRPSCFAFEETAFIAVTAYHSERITQLKIHNNPFAKAFRDADVTAVLQNSSAYIEPDNSTMPPICRGGLASSMQSWSSTVSMEWQPSSANQLDPNAAEYYPPWKDAPYRRFPEFPSARWSCDNVAALRPSGTCTPHAAGRSAESATRNRGHPQSRSHPTMTFESLGQSWVTSSGRHRHSTGGLRDSCSQLAAHRSLSHPDVSLGLPSWSQLTPPDASATSALSDAHFKLRRVSSTAIKRAVRQQSLPYSTPRAAVSGLPRWRSADNATFEGSRGQHHAHTPGPRRPSAAAVPAPFRASTGNLRGRLDAELPASYGPRIARSPPATVTTSTAASHDSAACSSSVK